MKATRRHRSSQCRLNARLSITMVAARRGMRANTPSAAGPQATVTLASGKVRSRWSSRPVEITASPIRVAVTNRMRTGRLYRIRVALTAGPVIRRAI